MAGWQLIEIVREHIGPEAANDLARMMKTQDPALVLRDAVAILEGAGIPLPSDIARAIRRDA